MSSRRLKISVNLQYLDKTVDRLTKSLIILIVFLAKLVEQNIRWRVAKSIIYTAQIYD